MASNDLSQPDMVFSKMGREPNQSSLKIDIERPPPVVGKRPFYNLNTSMMKQLELN